MPFSVMFHTWIHLAERKCTKPMSGAQLNMLPSYGCLQVPCILKSWMMCNVVLYILYHQGPSTGIEYRSPTTHENCSRSGSDVQTVPRRSSSTSEDHATSIMDSMKVHQSKCFLWKLCCAVLLARRRVVSGHWSLVQYGRSYMPAIIPVWNSLPDATVGHPTTSGIKAFCSRAHKYLKV